MYCSNCGKQNENGANFCTNCGTKLNYEVHEGNLAVEQRTNTTNYSVKEYTATTNEQTSENKKLKPFSNKAIAGFVLPFVGYFFAGIICGVLGIVFSSLALNEIEKKDMRGKGIAIAGLVLSIICTLICFAYYVLVW